MRYRGKDRDFRAFLHGANQGTAEQMLVQTITVKAGRTVNHPYESYSNLRQDVELVATIEPGEDHEAATKTLQAQAEQLVEDHKNNLLASIEEIHDMQVKEREAASLSRQIAEAQSRLDRIRDTTPRLNVAANEPENCDGNYGPD